jgi:signal transduction histidine kinase
MVRIYVKDISEIVINQQRASDELYKDSVLSNYSHEQLTPLNSFLNNSRTLLQDLNDLSKDIQAKISNIISTFD